MTRYFVEMYWPSPSRHAGDLFMWFHTRKAIQDEDVNDGDHVLIYEVGWNPDDGFRGSKSMFASGIVTSEREQIPEIRKFRGGKEWTVKRKLQKVLAVPPDKGIPLHELRRILGYEGNGWPRQGFSISRENFDVLEAELRRRATSVTVTRSL